MRKLFFAIILVSFLLPLENRAQTQKGDFKISLGAFSSYGYPEGLPSTATNSIPTTNLTAEYLIHRAFSIGAYTSYTYTYYKYTGPYPYKDVWREWSFGAKGSFYPSAFFKNNEKFDLYLTGFLGYTTGSLILDKDNIYRDELNYSKNDLSGGGILGLRYHLSPRMALFGEMGMARKFFVGAGASLTLRNKKQK